MKVVDRFTTQDGSWDVDISHPYGIDLIHELEYRDEASQLGGAHHIYVKVPSGARVMFRTADGQNDNSMAPIHAGWINFPMFGSSRYNPDEGQHGPWEVWVNAAKVADGIGLPYGWHVSTFLVVEEDNLGSGPTIPPVQGGDKIQLLVNGVVVWSN